jgi:hypothetical protein
MTTQTLPQISRLQATLVVLLLGLLVALGLTSPAGAATGHANTHRVHLAKHTLGFGAKAAPSRPLPRTIHASTLQSLPAQVDLRNAADLASPIGYQGQVGSCVTWAIDYAMLGWYTRHAGRPQTFNPMYTFSQIHGANGQGSYPLDALKIAQTQGNDTLAHYSHDVLDWWDTPNQSEVANAANYRITGYHTYATGTGAGSDSYMNWIANELGTNKRPVAIGLRVRAGFETEMNLNPQFGVAGSDIGNDTPLLVDEQGNVEYHEVLAIGYDQYGVWFQNSWGAAYGNNGYGRLTWAAVASDVDEVSVIDGLAAQTQTTDTTKPVMGAVTERLAVDRQITSTTEPVSFDWSASDGSGIAGYAVYLQRDGGAWSKDTNLAATATGVTYALSIGHSYRMAVAAQDGAGNWSAYAYSPTFTPRTLDDRQFSASSLWARYPLTDTFAGTYVASKGAGVSRSLTFTGRDVGLVAPEFASAGQATIYCDGKSIGTIDLYSAATSTRNVVASCHFATRTTHTMKVVVAGTSGRPWVGIDAFEYLS